MSNFQCEKCGVILYDSPQGYTTGCEHYPLVDTPSCEQKITAYLLSGGLFNPEFMNHDIVRDLLMDCRSELAAEKEQHGIWETWCREERELTRSLKLELAAALVDAERLGKFFDAWVRAEGSRGCYSCTPEHDSRCAITHKVDPHCNCGRKELEELYDAIDVARRTK